MYGRHLYLGVGLMIGMLIGCHNTPPPNPPKDQRDPLFNSKKPIEGRADEAVTEPPVYVDPPPPAAPPNQSGGVVVRERVPLGTPQPDSE
jgi:hypothetical protein